VERWRPLVESELSRIKTPLPVDLLLATIHVESRGYPGTTNEKSGASGLLQVMPKTLEWYNRQTGDKITLSQLRSSAHHAQQIRVGVWVLSQFWRAANNYLQTRLTEFPIDELARIADLFYVAGPEGAKTKLDQVAVPFYSYVAKRFPKWNALPHPKNVFSAAPSIDWNVGAISTWLNQSEKKQKHTANNSILAIVVVVVGYWWWLKGTKNGKTEN